MHCLESAVGKEVRVPLPSGKGQEDGGEHFGETVYRYGYEPMAFAAGR